MNKPAPKLATICLCLLALAAGLQACRNDDIVKRSYQTLAITGQAYDLTMKTAADLDAAGKLPPNVKTALIQNARKYVAAHNAAVAALEAYATAAKTPDNQKLQAAITETAKLLAELTETIRPFMPVQEATP